MEHNGKAYGGTLCNGARVAIPRVACCCGATRVGRCDFKTIFQALIPTVYGLTSPISFAPLLPLRTSRAWRWLTCDLRWNDTRMPPVVARELHKKLLCGTKAPEAGEGKQRGHRGSCLHPSLACSAGFNLTTARHIDSADGLRWEKIEQIQRNKRGHTHFHLLNKLFPRVLPCFLSLTKLRC